jgi:hypothetical protein
MVRSLEIKKVRVKLGTLSVIAKEYNCSIAMVSLSAGGKSNTRLAKQIRRELVKLGGDPIFDVKELMSKQEKEEIRKEK